MADPTPPSNFHTHTRWPRKLAVATACSFAAAPGVLLLVAVRFFFAAFAADGAPYAGLVAVIAVFAFTLCTIASLPAVLLVLRYGTLALAGDHRARSVVLGAWWIGISVFAFSIVGFAIAAAWTPGAVLWTVALPSRGPHPAKREE